MSEYVDKLNALKSQETHKPEEIKDQWRTPEPVYQAINALCGPFLLDLFTDGQNSKCPRYFTAEDNALIQPWAERLRSAEDDIDAPRGSSACFGNPPYSIKRAGNVHLTGMTHIMRKAHEEAKLGCRSVFLTKVATSETWWPNETASDICFIKGRIGFDVPAWFRPEEGSSKVTAAGFGAAIITFGGTGVGRDYISRDEILEIGVPLARENRDYRSHWIKVWDEL